MTIAEFAAFDRAQVRLDDLRALVEQPTAPVEYAADVVEGEHW